MTAQKARVQEKGSVLVTDGLGTGMVEGVFYGTGIMGAVLVGAWAVSCLVGGAIAAGGPLKLLLGWFQAVTGM